MKVNFNERLLVFTDKDLTDPRAMPHTFRQVFAIMLYPGDPDKQKLHILGSIANILDAQHSEQERKAYLPNDPTLLYDLYARKEEALKVFHDAITSRKKGHTGAPIVRGTIAGWLLVHLAKPHIGSLRRAFKEYSANPIIFDGEPVPASNSLLWKIWEGYRSVSHLWAGLMIYRELYGVEIGHLGPSSLSDPVDPEAAVHLSKYLRFASFFRNQLVDAKNPTTGEPLIADIASLWDLLMSNGNLIQAVNLSPEKNQ